MPPNFTWVDKPLLAGFGYPDSAEEIAWLRKQGIEIIIGLTETPMPRKWVNDAGLMLVHVPVPDMTAPDEDQFETIRATFRRARAAGLGVGVHCAAGRGRTGVVLASYFIEQGLPPREAIRRVRALRPGSIETPDQEAAVEAYARRLRGDKPSDPHTGNIP
jgi:atypical dual specificity phosphatase